MAQICETERFSPALFSCLCAGMEKADSWTDPRLGCCQADATILRTEAFGKRVAKLRTIRSGLSRVKCIKDKSSMSQALGRLWNLWKGFWKRLKDEQTEEDLREGQKGTLGGLSPETCLCGTTEGWGTKAEGNV